MSAMESSEIRKTVGVISLICTIVGMAVTLSFHLLVLGSDFGAVKVNAAYAVQLGEENKRVAGVLKDSVTQHTFQIQGIQREVNTKFSFAQ